MPDFSAVGYGSILLSIACHCRVSHAVPDRPLPLLPRIAATRTTAPWAAIAGPCRVMPSFALCGLAKRRDGLRDEQADSSQRSVDAIIANQIFRGEGLIQLLREHV